MAAGNRPVSDGQLLTLPPEQQGLSDHYARTQLNQAELGWLAALPAVLHLDNDVLLCHGTPHSDVDYLLEDIDDAAGTLVSGRARAAEASVASLGGAGDGAAARRVLVDSAGKSGAEADAAFPPTSIEVRLYAGLLAAHAGDRTGVQAALEATRDSPILRDYPTVAQLQQVLLAEQSRLNGKPQAAVAQLPWVEQAQVLGHAEPGHLDVVVDHCFEFSERAAVPLEEGVQQQPPDGIGQRLEHQVTVVHPSTLSDHLVTCQEVSFANQPGMMKGVSFANQPGMMKG